jgi:hypothetical protein
MTATRIALAAALLVGTTSAAMADCWDFNLANRYPSYAAPGAQAQALRYDPARVQQGRNVALPGRQNSVSRRTPRPAS